MNEGVAERSIHAQRWRDVEGIDGVGGRGSRHLDVPLPIVRASVSSKGLAGRWRCGAALLVTKLGSCAHSLPNLIESLDWNLRYKLTRVVNDISNTKAAKIA